MPPSKPTSRLPTTDKPSDDPRLPAWLRVLHHSGRLAVVAVIVWIVVTVIGQYALRRSPPTPKEMAEEMADETAEQDLSPSVPGVLLSDFFSGHWTFAGVSWQIAMSRPNQEQIETELLRQPARIEPRETVEPLEREVIELLGSLGARRSAGEDSAVYRLDRSGLRVVAFAALGQRHESLALVRIAMHEPDQGWRLIEARPSEDLAANVAEAEGLLPLPAGSRRLAQRWDRRGRLIGEVASSEHELTQLGNLWQQEGWTVKPVEGLSAAGSHLACVRGDELLYAWSQAHADAPAGLLFVIRAPDE